MVPGILVVSSRRRRSCATQISKVSSRAPPGRRPRRTGFLRRRNDRYRRGASGCPGYRLLRATAGRTPPSPYVLRNTGVDRPSARAELTRKQETQITTRLILVGGQSVNKSLMHVCSLLWRPREATVASFPDRKYKDSRMVRIRQRPGPAAVHRRVYISSAFADRTI